MINTTIRLSLFALSAYVAFWIISSLANTVLNTMQVMQ